MVDIDPVLTVHVLGPVEVLRDGQPLDLGGPQPRAIIAHLAIDAGRVVSVERLIDRLWGDEPPRTPLGTLQSYVSRLRRVVEPARTAGAAAQVLVSEAPGYVLQVPLEQIDVHRFGMLVADARRAAAAHEHARALELLDTALALWRGPALAGLGGDDHVHSVVVRLDEERDAAVEDRFEALLALGRHAEAAPALQNAVDEQPLRERLWALLALALYRSSRQADALRALGKARAKLLDEVGLDPGPELRELENRILAHDPTLLAAPAQPVPVTAPAPERRAGVQVELIGRSDEWRTLVGALDAASAHSQLVLIEGEAGIGKSTLCERFLGHATDLGWHVAIGRCVESGLAPSLWPCIEVVRTMVGEAPPAETTTTESNPLRSFVAGGAAGPPMSPVEMADHFVALVDELGDRPWVVLLDDLHWADRATLDMATLVLERLGDRRVLVVGAHRSPDSVPGSLLGEALGRLHRAGSAVRIQMSPLDAAGVAELMELTTGAAPSVEVAERVQARAGGNPLFVAELARLAGERGVSDVSGVPDAIRDVVRGRLAGLPDRATAELQVAAVLGERFDLRTAMAASERDPDSCLDALDAAIVTRILVPEGDSFRFAHALVRDAVLSELSSLRLARLHHRAAEAIIATRGEGPDEAEPIAHHRLAAVSMSDPVMVAKAAVRAADVARWRGALDAADGLADQALETLAHVARTPAVEAVEVEALEALVASAFRRTGPEALQRVVERVADVADRTGSEAARALHMFLTWGDIDESDDLHTLDESIERARRFVDRATDGYALVTGHFLIASYELLVGHLDAAAEHIDLAIAAAGAKTASDRPEHVPLVLLPIIAGICSAMRGREAEAFEHTHERAPAWLSQRAEVDPTAASALAFNRALVQALLDHPQAVVDELTGVQHHDEGAFIGHQTATCDLLLGWGSARLGDAEGAARALVALELVDQSTEQTLRGCLRSMVADACITIEDPRAVELLQVARAESEARSECWWLAEIIRLQAVADRRFGDGSRADALLDEAERVATEQGAALLLPRIAATRAG